MIALDTNVLVRLLVRDDDPDQTRRAAALLREGDDILVTTTVLLEAAWVLRTRFKRPRELILEGFRRFLGLPSVVLDDAPTVTRAIDWCAAGLDFADALHLASCGRASAVATFDRAFARRAARMGIRPPVRAI